MQRVTLLLFALLLLCSCSRADRRRIFGVPEVEPRYIQCRPGQLDIVLREGQPLTSWCDDRFKNAQYINTWLCTEDNLCAESPFYNHDNGVTVNVTINSENGCIAVVNYTEGAPWAYKLRVEFVN